MCPWWMDEASDCDIKPIPLGIATGWEIRLNHWMKNMASTAQVSLFEQTNEGRVIFAASKNHYGWIDLKVQYYTKPKTTYHISIQGQNDPEFHKSLMVYDEERAVAIVENWMEVAHDFNIDQLSEGKGESYEL